MNLWIVNSTHLCFNTTISKNDRNQWCGEKDRCSMTRLILPLLDDTTWPKNIKIVLYITGLFWCFFGVSMAADRFMASIEKICKSTRKRPFPASFDLDSTEYLPEEKVFLVKRWNDTVANLTLMALGSSAPDCLLTVIEILGNNFKAKALGPGIIVGSAAFNLLITSAVCILAIENGDSRKIEKIYVFSTTAAFSIFAYIWLLFILKFNTKNRVDLWEAIVTFCLFPVLVVIAFIVDKWSMAEKIHVEDQKQLKELVDGGQFQEFVGFHNIHLPNGELDKEELAKFIAKIQKATDLSEEDSAIIAAAKIVDSMSKSHMWYTMYGIRRISGGKKLRPAERMAHRLQRVYDQIGQHKTANLTPSIITGKKEKWSDIVFPDFERTTFQESIIQFHTETVSAGEDEKEINVWISRSRGEYRKVRVNVKTIHLMNRDGQPVAGKNYKAVDEIVTFNPNETQAYIKLKLLDREGWDPVQSIYMKLQLVDQEKQKVILGRKNIMSVYGRDKHPNPGTFQFRMRSDIMKSNILLLDVVRQGGFEGNVDVKWRTPPASNSKRAFNRDRESVYCPELDGVLHFKHGEENQSIIIKSDDFNDEVIENCTLIVELYEPRALIGELSCMFVMVIKGEISQNALKILEAELEEEKTWPQQFTEAMTINGGEEDNGIMDYILHFIGIGFKVLFAFIPPVKYTGGWLTFFASLAAIGLLIAIVGDLAEIFGCLIGLKDEVTAITIVAMGTSLPDLFGSKIAAMGESTADDALGNITGSNAFNVFVGLGIPWLIAAIYWQVNKPCNVANNFEDCGFIVNADSLGFSVAIFSGCAVIAIALIFLRRYLTLFAVKKNVEMKENESQQDEKIGGEGAELGGAEIPKILSALVLILLYILYVVLSTLQSYNVFNPGF